MYKIVFSVPNTDYSAAISELEDKVAYLLATEGWSPHGGISITTLNSDDDIFFIVCQALTKKNPKRITR